MALYLLNIEEYITNWMKVGGYKVLTDEQAADFVVDPDLYLEVTQNQWSYARNLIDAGSTITYPVSASPPTAQDLVVTSVTPLRAAKIRAATSIAHQVTQRLLLNGAMINLFKFVMADNILRNGGYTITDENRDQVYLDIVNAGVQKYITALEVYLDVRDNLNENLWFFNIQMTFEENLRTATTIAQVQNYHDIAMGYFE